MARKRSTRKASIKANRKLKEKPESDSNSCGSDDGTEYDDAESVEGEDETEEDDESVEGEDEIGSEDESGEKMVKKKKKRVSNSTEEDIENDEIGSEDESGEKMFKKKKKRVISNSKKSSKRAKIEKVKEVAPQKKNKFQEAPPVTDTGNSAAAVNPETEELKKKIKLGYCSLEEQNALKERLLNSINAFPLKYPNITSNLREIITEKSEELCELFHDQNYKYREFIIKVCTLLWPKTDICCLDPNSFDVFRNLFYSILAESLDDEEKLIYRKYEGKSTKEFNDALLEEENKDEIKMKRNRIHRKIENKFVYLKTSFKNIKKEIELRLCAIDDGDANKVHDMTENYLPDDHLPIFCFDVDDDKDLITWENKSISLANNYMGLFQFNDDDQEDDIQITNGGADDSSETDKSVDSLVVVENPKRSIRIIRAFLYLIAGGYINSPAYAKMGCSTAKDETFFNRINHYWIGSNPRFCFKLV
jgi:hypothetical protein